MNVKGHEYALAFKLELCDADFGHLQQKQETLSLLEAQGIHRGG